MSRAKAALRKAKEGGEPDRITAARDRLDAARAAHQDATTVRVAPDQRGDVTDRQHSTTKDTGMGDQDDSTRDDHQGQQYGGFVIHNTNIETGNARVGSQHDVYYGSDSPDADQVNDLLANAAKRAERAAKRAERAHRAAARGSRSTVNVTGGNDTVSQQTGWRVGNVTNIVNGSNYGIQTDIVHGVHITGPRNAGQHGDVTGPAGNVHVDPTGPTDRTNHGPHGQQRPERASADQTISIRGRVGNVHVNPTGPITITNGRVHLDQQQPPAHPHPDPTGGVRFRPDGGVDITGPDGHQIQMGRVTGEIWIDGRRVQ